MIDEHVGDPVQGRYRHAFDEVGAHLRARVPVALEDRQQTSGEQRLARQPKLGIT
jgi:hypothetical protein